MSWSSILQTILSGILGGLGASAMVYGLSKHLGDRWIESLKARYSKELAELAHVRAVLLSDRQNIFSMGATSHMAVIAFDKHIGFCEEYLEVTTKALQRISMAPSTPQEPLDLSGFFLVRQKWSLWLTDGIEGRLDTFESTIKAIAAGTPLVDDAGNAMSNERSVKTLIAGLRQLLATEELTALRSELITRSMRQRDTAQS
ncbi:MAG TPA: hypothetical protein VFO40_21305 [Chthoniobacterales bacterium]|nr:hypothetical protein [Chthoniobacterales bacterium]